MECLTISNTSLMVAEVTFFFHQDSTANTYLLDPPTMRLDPGQSRVCCPTDHAHQRNQMFSEPKNFVYHISVKKNFFAL